MVVFCQCSYSNRSNITNVYETGFALPNWHIDLASCLNFLTMGRVQVLHKKAGTQKCPVNPRFLNMFFDFVVGNNAIFFDPCQ